MFDGHFPAPELDHFAFELEVFSYSAVRLAIYMKDLT